LLAQFLPPLAVQVYWRVCLLFTAIGSADVSEGVLNFYRYWQCRRSGVLGRVAATAATIVVPTIRRCRFHRRFEVVHRGASTEECRFRAAKNTGSRSFHTAAPADVKR